LQLHFSEKIKRKLADDHNVDTDEVFECFFNLAGKFLIDTRQDNKTDPPTKWFISETDKGKKLKVCFIPIGGELTVKTAYPPNENEIRIYNKFAK
jgi:hypothetical protein